MKPPKLKPCVFIGKSLDDIGNFPEAVKDAMGYGLHRVQLGETPENAKALKGFGGRSVLELKDDFDKDTFRTVYTVKFDDAVYVLHAFQKKSKKGIKTPKVVIDLIKQRLAEAEQLHADQKKDRKK